MPDFGTTLFGENVGFIGLVALGLAGLGVWAGPARLGWLRLWVVAVSLFGVVMALGNQNGLYRLVAANIDVVAEFRVPARYLLLAYFPLAAAAALGTDALLGRDLGRLGARALQGLGGWPSSGWCSASPWSWEATATGSRAAAGGWWRPRLGCWPGWRPASGPCPGS